MGGRKEDELMTSGETKGEGEGERHIERKKENKIIIINT